MNNNNNWANNNRNNRESQHVNRKHRNGRGGYNRGRNNQRSNDEDRHFKKFVDTNHSNHRQNQWPKTDWNSNNGNNNCHNGPIAAGGIFPWIRRNPVNPLIIPQHITFDEQYANNQHNTTGSETDKPLQLKSPGLIKEVKDANKDTQPPKIESNLRVSASESSQLTKAPITIKQEYDVPTRVKKEKSKSSSSSSDESSSSEDEHKPQNKTTMSVKAESTTIPQPPPSPIDIKLRPRVNSELSTPVKLHQKSNASSSSSSSSSSEEDSDSSAPPGQITTSLNKKEGRPKSSLTQRKVTSEDEVVCIGNLENKIILEDESESGSKEICNEVSEKMCNKIPKKDGSKAVEKCMICDKKGHTSFQCQMICKNCSAPYHGYRTCTQPANLNTMMQLFMEFCMQQLQNFKVEHQSETNSYDSVTMPQVEISNLVNAINKTNKLKRKHSKSNETVRKNKASKKRKTSATKKNKSKGDSSDMSSDDSEDTDSEKTSSETDSDSSAESLISSKKKHKLKTKNASKPALSLSDFSANPVNLPMVLNGFPHLAVPGTQDPSTSTNALNTLLLTQMFQNAIGSLKNKKNK